MKKISFLVELLPLLVFLYFVKDTPFPSKDSEIWEIALSRGFLCVLFTLSFWAWQRFVLDRILLGADLFLGISALGFRFGNESFPKIFETYLPAFFYGSLAIVGITSTLVSRNGYLGVESKKIYSWILLGITVVAVGFSYLFHHHIILSGIVPYLIIEVARRFLILRSVD